MVLPNLVIDATWPPDPLTAGQFYRGVVARRILAYLVDLMILTMIMIGLHAVLGVLTILSFGLLWPLHLLFVPLAVAVAYHTLLIGSPSSATIGMQVFNLKVYSIDGGPPSLIQAFIQTICFYATWGLSCGILFLAALFNAHRRTLHDFLGATIVLRNTVS